MTEAAIEKTTEVIEQDEKELVERPILQRTFKPRVDIFEAGDSVLILAEMPGVGEEGIEVTLEKDILTVRGEVQHNELDGYKPAYIEHPTGNFERAFKITDDVDHESIEATIDNGLLTVVLPKAEKAKAKKIIVKSA